MFVCQAATHVLVHTPAKLNLFLEVLARRADGLHEIETLMAAVTIFDTLEFIPRSEGDLRLSCRWAGGMAAQARRDGPPLAASVPGSGSPARLGDLPQGRENIVQRAVARLADRSAFPAGAQIQLTKRIPSAAGLGGASSDAAAALVAANLAWKLGWPRDRLMELAAELGSDIPFFLSQGWAICRSRGEQIQPTAGGHMHAVVVRPPVGLSTAEVYRQCQPAAVAIQLGALPRSLAEGDWRRARGKMINRLEEPATQLTPWIDSLKCTLRRLGCVAEQMSGSGSSCFGICRSARHAQRVAAQLRAMDVGAVFQTTTSGGN